jgi:hypothetical protein
VAYSVNQDSPYLIASGTTYNGATTNWSTYGFQHRLKVNSSGVPRVTIDTNTGELFSVANAGVGIGIESPYGKLDVSGTVYAQAGALFNPPGVGTDTSTTSAFALDSGSAIVGVNNGYIRNMFSWTVSSDITIGQGGTSLIGGINLIAGSSGNVKVNGQRVFAENYHPNADQWTNSRTVTFATGDVTGNFSIDGSGDVSDVALTVGDDSHNHSSSSGNFTVGGNLTVTGDTITMGNVSTRDKYRVWSNAPYSIGMQNSFTFGALNTDYAMTFQMNDDANRGFWWGDASHTQAQGAMALSTGGKLTVANSVRLGYGEGDTTVPGATYALDVSGEAYISANTTIGGSLQIDGDLTVSGETVTINVTDLAVEDNMIYLNSGSVVTNPDLGFAGNYNDGTYAHAGFFRDATDGYFKVFKGYTLEPDASAFIDTSHASFALADIQAANFRGALVGNASTASSAAKWTTSRTVTFATGDVTGSFSIDGSGDVSDVALTVGNDSHTHDGRYYTETESNDLYMKRGTPSTTTNIDTIASSSDVIRWNNTTVGRPASGQVNEYGPLLQMSYDGNNVSQLAHDFDQDNLYFRKLATTTDTGSSWKQLFHDGYHPNADQWTTGRTLTIGATGKTVTGADDVSWSRNEIIGAPPAGGDWWNGNPIISATNGVTEIGRYIDFHNTDTTTSDYTIRMDNRNVNLLNIYGSTLASTKVGIGISGADPTAMLEVAGSLKANDATFAGGIESGNIGGYKDYSCLVDFGSAVAGTWLKLVDVTSPDQAYSAIGFTIDVIDNNSNLASIASVDVIDRETYYVHCVRTNGTVLNDPDACYVRGMGNRIRAVKTATGVYQIQIQNEALYKDYRVDIKVHSYNGSHTVVYSNGATASNGTAQYNASVSTGNADIFGNISTRTITTSGDILLNNGNADGANLYFYSQGFNNWSIDNASGAIRLINNGQVPYSIDTNGTHAFRNTSGTDIMRIVSTGNVGIGTSTPEAPLTIVPGGTSTTSIGGRNISYGVNTIVTSGRTGYLCRVGNNFTGDGDNAGFQWIYPFDSGGNVNNKVFRSATGATLVDKFWVNQVGGGYFAGNVGIGASTPQSILHARQDQDGTTRAIIQNRLVTGTPVSELAFLTGAQDITDNRYAYIQSAGASSNYLAFGTSNGAAPVEHMRIGADGLVDIVGNLTAEHAAFGTGANIDGNYVLNINTTTAADSGILVNLDKWINDSSENGIFVDIDATAAIDDITANRTITGVRSEINTYTPQNATTTTGVQYNSWAGYFSSTIDDNTSPTYTGGKTNTLYGTHSRARHDGLGGASNVRGAYNLAQAGSNSTTTPNTIDNLHGAVNYALNSSNSTTITNSYGSYNHAHQSVAGGTTTNAFGVYSRLDQDAGTAVNGYAFRGSFEGTWTGVKRGLWITGDLENSVDGNFSIGGSVTIGDGTADTRLIIKRVDGTTSDDIQFFNGTTRMGEIGTQDTSWLRINQQTNKNIYTPRLIRADGGFQSDFYRNPDDTGVTTIAGGITAGGNIELYGPNHATVPNQIFYDAVVHTFREHDASPTFATLDATNFVAYGDIVPDTDDTGNVGTSALTFNRGWFTNLTVDSTIDVRGAIDLADSDEIRFGSSDDFRIFYDGTANEIEFEMEAACSQIRIHDNGTTRFTLARATGDFTATGITQSNGFYSAGTGTGTGFRNNGTDSAAFPGFTWNNDEDTGMYRAAANQIGLTTAGVSRFVLTNTTATFTGDVVANSDIRLKKDIENITDALKKVNKLNGVNFTKIENDRRSTGLIAQDVQAVLPEAVAENEEGYLSVAYGNMVGLLVEAIKEQDSTINSLRNDVETLKELVNKLMETR